VGENRGNVGGVPGEKQIQREAIDEVKGERVSWKESWWGGISGVGRDVRGWGGKASAEQQHGNEDFRCEGRKRLGT